MHRLKIYEMYLNFNYVLTCVTIVGVLNYVLCAILWWVATWWAHDDET